MVVTLDELGYDEGTAMAVEPRAYLFTVEDFQRMGASGILDEDQRVELVEGVVVEMTPIGSPHMAIVNRATQIFVQRFAGFAVVQVQGPVNLSDISQLQPDLALLQAREDFYKAALAGPPDIHLLVEVADSSLRYDTTIKSRLYAAAGITEFWVIDVSAGELERYRSPRPRGYGEIQRLRRGQALAPLAFPDTSIAVEELLGPLS